MQMLLFLPLWVKSVLSMPRKLLAAPRFTMFNHVGALCMESNFWSIRVGMKPNMRYHDVKSYYDRKGWGLISQARYGNTVTGFR